jgi:putative colanic acid biosynthesis UDP-glucose lipid carrier transferase
MFFIAVGIKLTSKGPVLFKQTRYGMEGEKIKVWKFRSMTVTEDGEKVTQAKRGDK